MSNRKTELDWSPDAAAREEAARVNGDDAHRPDAEANNPAPEPLPHEPALADAPPPPPPAPPAWRDFPVASVLPPMAPLLPPPTHPAPLEDRLQRLEAELSRLRSAPTTSPHPATSVVRQPGGGFWGGVGKRLLAPSGPAAATPPKAEGLASMVPAGVRRTWVLLDALTELRAMYWMYFDPRYRLSWLTRLAPLVIVGLILTSAFWVPGAGLPFLGGGVEKLVDLVLAYVLFKLLSHEARRYRETAPDLPPGLRQ